ncbi:MAG: Uma2 family endonuclease [Trueperaceae bacterium]
MAQAVTERQRKQFTYRELLELDRIGIFENQHVELLDGELIIMSPPNPPHAITTGELRDALGNAFINKAKVWMQNPLRLSEDMEDKNLPLPDVLVLRPRVYRDHPRPEDVFLLVEVALSSAKDDREKKLPLYAQYGIQEYWIVNLITKHIEVYTDPVDIDYLTKRSYQLTEAFALKAFPDVVKAWLPETIYEVLEP